jgi:arsenate reductase
MAESNISFEFINYLENPIKKEEIIMLVKKLNIKPIDLVRKKKSFVKIIIRTNC